MAPESVDSGAMTLNGHTALTCRARSTQGDDVEALLSVTMVER